MQNNFRGLGVSTVNDTIYSFVADTNNPGDTFIIQGSSDGHTFKVLSTTARISSINLPLDVLEMCSNFHVSVHDDYFYLSYVARKKHSQKIIFAQSRDLIAWEKIAVVSEECSSGKIIPNFTFKDHLLMYCGGKTISLYATNTFTQWYCENKNLLDTTPRRNLQYTIADVTHIKEGIFVTYYEVALDKADKKNTTPEGAHNYVLKAVLFDQKNPAKILWQSAGAIHDIQDKEGALSHPFAMITRDDEFVSYWQGKAGSLFLFAQQFNQGTFVAAKAESPKKWKKEDYPLLERVPENPIMEPETHHAWETKAAFNPAAIFVDGTFHILYRAIGENDVSVLGYAQSDDGINITKRLMHPAYVPREIFEGALTPLNKVDHENWSPYMSGGGAWGGCEDPRLNRIDDRIYLTYVAYNGWQPPRLAMSYITIEDFLSHNWNWSKPVLISPPGIVSKSGSILPEKIDGHYVFFHRVFPDIHIDFVDDLNRFDGRSFFLKCQNSIKVRENQWDAGKFSIGAPPMKTKDGWLVIYSAVSGRQEWEGSDLRYKIGAMLLDLKDPTKVIYRCNQAILEPEEHYENDGAKYGIIYPCGAVINNNKLFVYYGGSDEFTCVATADLDQFLEKLKMTGKVESGNEEIVTRN